MPPFWNTFAELLKAGQRVFLAAVVAHEEHSPGTAGAKLFVAEDDTTRGSIGGGIMEYNVIQQARQVLAAKDDLAPSLQVLDHRPGSTGTPSGLVCAGSQTNLYALLHPHRDAETIARVARLVDADRSGTLRIDPAGLHVTEEPHALERPVALLTRQAASWCYTEQLLNRKRLAILGGGHCALALSRTMRQLGYSVQVFGTHAETPTFQDNPYARTVSLSNYGDAAAHIAYARLTCVVLMTDSFEADVQGLLGVLPHPFPFIGLMGSHAKIGRVYSRLRQAGVSKADFDRVHAPIGLPIESDTPEEIAVSVAAQLILLRNTGHLN